MKAFIYVSILGLLSLALTACRDGASSSSNVSPSISITTGSVFFSSASTVPEIRVQNTGAIAETFTPTLTHTSGISINDPNSCISLSLAPNASCVFTLTATANATTLDNNPGTLSVTGSANGQTASDESSITLAAPVISINGGNIILLNSANSYSSTASVALTGGFNLQNANVTASLPTNVNITATTCTDQTVSASSPCSITVADQRGTHSDASGSISVSGTNLSTAATQIVSIDDATFTAQSSRTHLSAMYALFSNPTGADISINNPNGISVAGSGANPLTQAQITIMTVDPDTQNAAYGFIATTNALYMMQGNSHVQRCTETADVISCTDLGDTGVGLIDTSNSDIVVAPELTIS